MEQEGKVDIFKTAEANAESKTRMQSFYENEYMNSLVSMHEKFDSSENCACLVGPAAYLIKIGNTRIAVDIAPGILPISKDEQEYLSEWISAFDAYIITHAHADHYDSEFFAALPDGIKKFVPDFMDISVPGVIATEDGMEFLLNNIRLCFFESAHSRDGNIVKEYGFYIDYNGEQFVFPADVRDYCYKYPAFNKVRILFAHLWLGRGNALNYHFDPYIDDFCRFIKSFGAKECYLAHMNDIHRTLDEMWSEIHFNVVKEKLNNVRMFRVGDFIEI